MEYFTYKNVVGILAIALTFVGYVPYFKDLLSGKTTPHIFSWFIWAVVTTIIFALQVSAGAGIGSLVTLAVAAIALLIVILGFKKGNKVIKKIDVVFLVLALFAIPLWLIIDQPVLSIIILSTIDMLGFAPTIRKSWNKPYSETLSLYIIATFRHGLSLFALAHFNIVTILFPATWMVANTLFSIMLLARRKLLSKIGS